MEDKIKYDGTDRPKKKRGISPAVRERKFLVIADKVRNLAREIELTEKNIGEEEVTSLLGVIDAIEYHTDIMKSLLRNKRK